MNIRERIILFCNTVGITKTEFERRAGLSNGYTNSVRRGVGNKLPQILAAFPQLNKNWLLFEEGDMLKSIKDENDKIIKEIDLGSACMDLSVTGESEEDNRTVGERLDEFIKSKGLGRYQFEMKCGLSQGYVANIRNSPHPDKLKKIANVFPELNIEWLMIGRGEMLRKVDNAGPYTFLSFYQQATEARFEHEKLKREALEKRIQDLTDKLMNLIKK